MIPLIKTYCFKKSDFTSAGFHKTKDTYLFLNFINECERNFYQEHNPFYGNALFASVSTMSIIKSCSNFDDNEILGMESLNGEIDQELNSNIERHSEFKTYRAMGSCIKGKEDFPVWLVVDDSLTDSEIALKYVTDKEI